jgi:hypothetical protein
VNDAANPINESSYILKPIKQAQLQLHRGAVMTAKNLPVSVAAFAISLSFIPERLLPASNNACQVENEAADIFKFLLHQATYRSR